MKRLMKKTIITLALAAIAAAPALGASADKKPKADTIRVTRAIAAGPVEISLPAVDGVKDAAGKEFSLKNMLTAPLKTAAVASDISSLQITPAKDAAVSSLTFGVKASGYTKASVAVKGIDDYKVIIDGKPAEGETALLTGTHRIDVVMATRKKAEPQISLVTANPEKLTVTDDLSSRYITIYDILEGKRIYGAWLSPDGSMLLTAISDTKPGGKADYTYKVTSTDNDRELCTPGGFATWMPKSQLLWATEKTGDNRRMVTFDPRTGNRSVIAENLPEGRITVSPTEDYLIITTVTKGPKEGKVYQVLEPEDRQPGWRDRTSVQVYDLATGVMRPLTFGYRNSWVTDLSADGTKALVMSSRSRYEKRPTTLFTVAIVDVATAKADTIVAGDGFISTAMFSPDAKKVLVKGSAESLGGVGKAVPEGMIPSMTEGELFMIDPATGSITALTRDFNPSVNTAEWSKADGKIYFTAEDGDMINLYTLDPATRKTVRAVKGEDIVTGFSLPASGQRLVWKGQGASNSDRLYLTDLRRKSQRRLLDTKADRLADVKLGRCEAWNFVNERGDTIIGRYYLPPEFDPAKKYPVIVNYYGGCSPTERTFESRYPHHLYAANGYVVYVLNPSGCTGRGQEFAARHVNTAGHGPAEDIIEGTRRFLREHEFTDSTKVGCIGASYGGFMTQYLQTQTDMFAAAISHAGISDHTSYWGEGYWGYSYSEVSMAESYPWSETDLYVKQSPLYNAHKIHTPLLFLHGDADHNVPVGESIQMFTALKLLGRPTAFVAVADQDHHIIDYDKRIRWNDTIFAWFDKYLRGDSSAWDALYPPKDL